MRLILILLTAFSFPAFAEVYKWTDAQGNVHFGTQPPPGQQEEVKIRASSASSNEPAPESDIIRQAREVQLDGSSDLPARAVWDASESAERLQYGRLRLTMDLNVGFMDKVDRGINQSAQGNTMLAELINDALSSDPTLGGLCEQINYSDSVIDYPESGQSEIAVLAAFQIVYEIDSASPYTQ